MARIQFTEKANLGKKVSESLPKQPRVAESLSKLEEVKAEEQVWKYQVQPFVLYTVVERKWVEAHDHLIQKNPEDDPESNRVLAVKFSSEAVPEALTHCEQETRRFSLLSLFPGGGLPRVPCGLVELCGFMAKVTKVDETASKLYGERAA